MTTLVASFTPGANRNDFGGYVGLKFAPTGVNITASSLGVRVPSGINNQQNVYILNASNTVLASATINIVSAVPGTFIYQNITPITLVVGTTYFLVVQVFNGGGSWADTGAVTLNGAGSAANIFSSTLGSFGSNNANQMYAGVDLNGTPPSAPGSQLDYWNRRKQINISAYDDEFVDDDYTRKTLAQFRQRQRVSYMFGTAIVGVSKFVQFDVIAPPDNAVDVSKFVQFDVIAPPDNAVDVSKFVQFVVIETLPSIINTPMLNIERRIINPWAEFDETDFNRDPLVRRMRLLSTTVQDASPSLTGQVATSAITAPSIEIDYSISGLQITGSIGTVSATPTIDISVTGLATTSALGTINILGEPALIGLSSTATFTAPSIQIDEDFNLTGIQIAGSIGTPISEIEMSIDGFEATADIGDLIVATDGSISVIGRSATASIGTLAVAKDAVINMTGVQATSGFSVVLPFISVPGTNINLTGLSASALFGILDRGTEAPILGVSATGQIGVLSLVKSATGFIMENLNVSVSPPASLDNGVSVRYSTNGGSSWTQPIVKSLGETGDYSRNLSFRNNGIARSMVYEVSWSSNFKTALGGATILAEVSNS